MNFFQIYDCQILPSPFPWPFPCHCCCNPVLMHLPQHTNTWYQSINAEFQSYWAPIHNKSISTSIYIYLSTIYLSITYLISMYLLPFTCIICIHLSRKLSLCIYRMSTLTRVWVCVCDCSEETTVVRLGMLELACNLSIWVVDGKESELPGRPRP